MKHIIIFLALYFHSALAWSELSAQETNQPHLAKAVEKIRKQVEWFGPNPKRYSREFLFGLATMNYVQSRVSPLNYSHLIKSNKQVPQTPEECLALEAGICGNQVQTFLTLINKNNLRARPVEFYLREATPAKNHSHICAEIFYKGQWRFFDITWGTYFIRTDGAVDEVLSWEQIKQEKSPRKLAVTNKSNLWYQQWCAAGLDPFEYLDFKEIDVLTGRNGTIHLQDKRKPNLLKTTYTPTHQPNYVGRNSLEKDRGSVQFTLLNSNQEYSKLKLDVLGKAGDGKLIIENQADAISIALSQIDSGPLELDISELGNKQNLHIRVIPPNANQVGYLVFKQITLYHKKQ